MQDTEPGDQDAPEPTAARPGADPRPRPTPRPRSGPESGATVATATDPTPDADAVQPTEPDADADADAAKSGPTPAPASTGLLDDIVGRSAPRPAARKTREGGTRGRVLVAVGVLALAGLIAGLVARTYEIPSESMESTLHGCRGCDNDRVLVDRLVYRFGDPAPGEVVVFNAGTDVWKNSEVSTVGETNPIVRGFDSLLSAVGIHQPVSTAFVKRVIAVGGQTVACCDARNRVMIDQQGIDEPYLYYPPAGGPARQESFAPVTVPAGQMFVMGDNRNQSVDSRAKGNGPVPVSSLVGKVRYIVLPLGRMDAVESVDPHARPAR